VEWNVFAMHLDNMIHYVGNFIQSNYENFGEMRSFGTDIDVKYDLTPTLYVYGNATYQDLRDSREFEPASTVPNPTKGDRMPNVPYFFANAGFEWHASKGDHDYKFYVENSFVEEYFYDFEQSAFQERRIPRSSVFNLGFEYSRNDKELTVGLQINNVTDEDQITVFNRPMPGRSVAFKMRYVFK
jgi:outer membrane receptor protein involved in Fe transport